ncbi:MAG: hypothetical protein IJJ82_03035 [Clostridia bacterium]|nr:hypothetical protein [Clostridia bacterium]
MKKMLATILVLLIIFIGMLIYRTSEKEAEIKIDEINKIENYIKKIYGWKEVSNEALPEFDNINNADEKWLWGTLRENIDDYEFDYEKIESTAKEIFGENFNKEYPKAGTEFISFDEQNGKYQIKGINIDAISDLFLINKIEKNKDGYVVEIVEYLVDYTNSETGKIRIINTKDEEVYELTEEDATEGNIKKVVKENMDKFTKKIVKLEKDNDKIFIKSVNLKN